MWKMIEEYRKQGDQYLYAGTAEGRKTRASIKPTLEAGRRNTRLQD